MDKTQKREASEGKQCKKKTWTQTQTLARLFISSTHPHWFHFMTQESASPGRRLNCSFQMTNGDKRVENLPLQLRRAIKIARQVPFQNAFEVRGGTDRDVPGQEPSLSAHRTSSEKALFIINRSFEVNL